MKDYKSLYLEIIQKIIKSGHNLLYITIRPSKDISLNSLRFLVKKSIRDIGKSLSVPYPDYLSVIEISSDISKGRIYIKELGLHSHMFLDISSMDNLSIGKENIENLIRQTFEKRNVEVDIKIIDDLYDINRLKGYHLKQSNYLTPGFIDTNLPGYDKKIERIRKYLHNLLIPYKIKRKCQEWEK